jgi:16S rRNA (cytosine1402-N4)-methyltransferase
MSPYHLPVLINEVIAYLAPQPNGVYVDATFGGGGHTRALLEAEPTCHVIAFDWDKQALELNSASLKDTFHDRITFIWGNFAQMQQLLKKEKITSVDGILADFGTSQYQIKQRAGFSFAVNTLLDMRMSPAHQKTTASHIVNYAQEEELARIFFMYGEESRSRAIAQAICRERKRKRIKTTGDLVDIVLTVLPLHSRGRIHPATKVFQALRIVVNKELDNIHSFLLQTPRVLKEKGRLVCISFHSLEDRLVKQFLRDQRSCFKTLTPKVIMAQLEEVNSNPASRSARLRAAERLSIKSC